MLAAIGHELGFGETELMRMTARRMRFWSSAGSELAERRRAEAESKR